LALSKVRIFALRQQKLFPHSVKPIRGADRSRRYLVERARSTKLRRPGGRAMSRPDPRDVCDRCRQSFDQRRRGPMVHDHIWQQLAKRGERALYDGCMYARAHERLGRVLTLADLRPCPWNLFHSPRSWFDLFVEFSIRAIRSMTIRATAYSARLIR